MDAGLTPPLPGTPIPPQNPTITEPNPTAPVAPAAPNTDSPADSFEDGGEIKTGYGNFNNEFGFTGILIMGLMVVYFSYGIILYRKRIAMAGEVVGLHKQIKDLQKEVKQLKEME